MENPNIGLVGAGALGTRHLQALARTNRSLNIYILDPSELSLKKAEEQYYQMNDALKHKVIFTKDIKQLPKQLDIVIVATSSNVRKKVIKEVLLHASVDYFILEKVLFQKIEDYLEVSELLYKHKAKAWVNCPRRLFNFYQELKVRLASASSMEISISGSNWGLGCNVIHFIDLIAFLAGCRDLDVDISGLEEFYIDSKREGFLEINGTITGKIGRCKNFSITSYPNNETPITIQVNSDVLKCFISEVGKYALIAEVSSGWEMQKEVIQIPYQSELTQLIVQDLLDTGGCMLTDYDTSKYLHCKIQEPLIQYFEKLGVEGKLCPIT